MCKCECGHLFEEPNVVLEPHYDIDDEEIEVCPKCGSEVFIKIEEYTEKILPIYTQAQLNKWKRKK